MVTINKKRALFATAVFGLLTCVSVYQAKAADQAIQEINSQCTTDATGGDGARHSCDANPSTIKAPPGFVFNDHTVEGGETSGNGDEHSCALRFADNVEIVQGTGLLAPTTAILTSHAKSPSGHWAGRGWIDCTFKISLVKYK